MKKFLMMAVMALCMVMPGIMSSAAAANIVVLPVINNTTYEGINETFYDNAIDVIKGQTKYFLIDNDAVTTAIDKYTTKGVLPTKEVLMNIAGETDADLVLCIELDTVKLEESYFGKENKADLLLAGYTVSYDRETGKFFKRTLHETETYDPAMYTRQNYPLRKFARLVQHEMRRVMNVKGFKVEKPHFQKF